MLACKVKPYRLVERDEEYKGGDEPKNNLKIKLISKIGQEVAAGVVSKTAVQIWMN